MRWRHAVFLQRILQLSTFYLQLQDFYMCPFSCPQDVETIFELHPYTLQHSSIKFFQNCCNPCTKCGNIWNRGCVDMILDVPPKVAKNRMSLSHVVHALYFFVTVAGLCGHSVYWENDIGLYYKSDSNTM
jgi:hypothetical protein